MFYRNTHTAALALNSNAPKLSVLAHKFGEGKLMEYIKLWLADLNASLALKNGLNPNQIDQISFAIIDKYRSLNLAEVNLIFKHAKYGEYGDIMRISIPTVMRWFKAYYDERLTIAAEQSYQQSVQHKSGFANVGRSSEQRITAADHTRKAVEHFERQQDLKETQKRVDQAKKTINKKNKNND